MIQFAFKCPEVTGPHVGSGALQFRVVHPSNGAVIAYCSTREEAERVARAIEDLFAVIVRVTP